MMCVTHNLSIGMADTMDYYSMDSEFIKIMVSWVVTPCSLVYMYQRFGGICCLHFEVRRVTLLP
jgi:hypothetical protein